MRVLTGDNIRSVELSIHQISLRLLNCHSSTSSMPVEILEWKLLILLDWSLKFLGQEKLIYKPALGYPAPYWLRSDLVIQFLWKFFHQLWLSLDFILLFLLIGLFCSLIILLYWLISSTWTWKLKLGDVDKWFRFSDLLQRLPDNFIGLHTFILHNDFLGYRALNCL